MTYIRIIRPTGNGHEKSAWAKFETIAFCQRSLLLKAQIPEESIPQIPSPPSSSTSESLARRKADENQTVSLSPWM